MLSASSCCEDVAQQTKMRLRWKTKPTRPGLWTYTTGGFYVTAADQVWPTRTVDIGPLTSQHVIDDVRATRATRTCQFCSHFPLVHLPTAQFPGDKPKCCCRQVHSALHCIGNIRPLQFTIAPGRSQLFCYLLLHSSK